MAERMWFKGLQEQNQHFVWLECRSECNCGGCCSKAQTLPLPDMYGKNLIFKTGGVDGCDCEETLKLIAEGKINTEPLITHTYPLSRIEEAYELFENKRDGVIKVAVEC